MVNVKCLASVPNKRRKQPYRVNIDGYSSLLMLTWKEVTEIVRSADKIREIMMEVKSNETKD